MIINIRGTSGSGKSTLVKRFLDEYPNEPLQARLGNWKSEKIVAYKVTTGDVHPTYVIGPYRTQCGGCDALSYKGSHTDIEEMVREAAQKGNVIFEGLTISSTITRWLNVSKDFPNRFIWAFMMTPEEECYHRILARSGREPKRDVNGLADYNKKYRGCMKHIQELSLQGERTLELTSDDEGYKTFIEALNGSPTSSY
jgi:GTPase SAR1 family protein